MKFSRVVCILMVCIGLFCSSFSVMAQKKDVDPETTIESSTAANKINLNSATAEQLMSIPGIGPATAKLIIEHRAKAGTFSRVEEIMNIRGIGEKKFAQIKNLLTV